MKLFLAMQFAIVFFVIQLIFTPALNAQESSSDKIASLKKLTEKIYGPDDVLINGKAHRQLLSDPESHPYFLSENWKQGSLIVNGDYFEDQLLKYNLQLDKIILGHVDKTGTFSSTALNGQFVSEFIIDHHHFIKINRLTSNSNVKGYVELITNQKLVFFVKHKKHYSIFRKSYEAGSDGKFYQNKPLYFILYKGKVSRVANQKSFLNYFADHKKKIRQYINRNNIDFRKASSIQLKNLIEFCQTFLNPSDE